MNVPARMTESEIAAVSDLVYETLKPDIEAGRLKEVRFSMCGLDGKLKEFPAIKLSD